MLFLIGYLFIVLITYRKPSGLGRGRGRGGRDDIGGGNGQPKGGMRGSGGMDEGGRGRSQGDGYGRNPSGNR
ncbi:hypothetical protein Tco_0380370, partial [Tanacetum coccineum]